MRNAQSHYTYSSLLENHTYILPISSHPAQITQLSTSPDVHVDVLMFIKLFHVLGCVLGLTVPVKVHVSGFKGWFPSGEGGRAEMGANFDLESLNHRGPTDMMP